MVNVLIQYGADVNQRSVGQFFRPTDQKKTKNKLSFLAKHASRTEGTNYEG